MVKSLKESSEKSPRFGAIVVSAFVLSWIGSSAVWALVNGYWYWLPVAAYLGLISAGLITVVVGGLGWIGLRVSVINDIRVRVFVAVSAPWVGSSVTFGLLSNFVSPSFPELVVTIGVGVLLAVLTTLAGLVPRPPADQGAART